MFLILINVNKKCHTCIQILSCLLSSEANPMVYFFIIIFFLFDIINKSFYLQRVILSRVAEGLAL